MATITLTQAEAARDGAYNALLKAQKALSFNHEGSQINVSIMRQKLKALREDFIFWESLVNELSSTEGEGVILSEIAPNYD